MCRTRERDTDSDRGRERRLKKGRMKWVRLSKLDTKEHRTKEESKKIDPRELQIKIQIDGQKRKALVEEKGSI